MTRVQILFLSIIFSGIVFQSCTTRPAPDKDNGGLVLPNGFGALVVVDSLPAVARHLTVNKNGDIYVKGRFDLEGGNNWALRDLNGDGKVDSIKNFGKFKREGAYSTAMKIHNGYLYTSSEMLVYRYKLKTGQLIPTSDAEVIVVDSGARREHNTKPIAFDNKGNIYVAFGAPSDACQEKNRIPSSPGMYPCPILDSNAGIWMFDESKLNQFRTSDGKKVATGVRSVVGLDWNFQDNSLYAVVHGRDNLHQTWSQYYSSWQNAVLPSEGFYKLLPGANVGWPYYYFDQMKGQVMVNPEYGGDGNKVCTDSSIIKPAFGFPGHYAPNDLIFYTGDQFPERYKNGAFVALHGSTIRSPYPQAGYFVAFIPFKDGKAQKMEVFADGFAGQDTLVNTADAKYRPMGLSVGPDGSLYISDSKKGKIWRVMYTGGRKKFSDKDLEGMRARENRTNIKNPDPVLDNVERTMNIGKGEQLYNTYCRSCHQGNGMGDGNRYPPLVNSEWVNGDKKRLISVLLKGLEGPIKVLGKEYNNVMPKFNFLNNEQLADLMSHVRKSYSSNKGSVKKEEVENVRKLLEQ
jgi:glucose/arabinose dehydrogenase/mono/diheme cytochrome c family protein